MRFSPRLIAPALAVAAFASSAAAQTPADNFNSIKLSTLMTEANCQETGSNRDNILVKKCVEAFTLPENKDASFNDKVVEIFSPATPTEKKLIQDQLANIQKDSTRCKEDGERSIDRCASAMFATLGNKDNNNDKGVSDSAIRRMIDLAMRNLQQRHNRPIN